MKTNDAIIIEEHIETFSFKFMSLTDDKFDVGGGLVIIKGRLSKEIVKVIGNNP